MGFTIETSISALTVFLQGIISFFSPCVLPLVPLYIGYLAGGTKTVDEDGTIHYKKSKVMVNTLFFVIGVSFAFFLLGFGFSAAGRFFSGNRVLFARIGGIIVILFGLFQIGFLNPGFLNRERRLPLSLDKFAMNPVVALILGFTFSFAWTPCVGPALASVLLMASSAASSASGYLLIGLYTLGFVLPFLAVGIFTGTVLDFFKKHQKVVQYTVKVGGALLILMGVMMFTGWMNGITGYLSSFGGNSGSPQTTGAADTSEGETESRQQESTTAAYDNSGNESSLAEGTKEPPSAGETQESTEETEPAAIPAPDFTLTDQYGVEHTLSDYKGKTVFLNFWATWCGPCQREMPDIQALYEENGENAEDLVVLGIANPKNDENPRNQDVSEEEVTKFLEDGGYTYPTVYDTTGEIFAYYGITAFPTTCMIDKDGNVFGYVSGTLTRDIMDDIIRQTKEGVRK